MRYLFFLLFTLLICQVTLSQNKIEGSISTKDGLPAANVNIEIKEQKRHTVSLENGSFVLNNLPPGKYTIIASFTGLQTQTKQVLVNDALVPFISFVLAENAAQLEEVIVTSRRNQNEKPVSIGKIQIKPMDLPQSVAVIDKSVMERQQSLRLGEVVANTTGIYVYGNTGGSQEELGGRGYAFSSSNTFKNGVRYNNAVMPEISALEKVEVLKGSAAILFGNVAAGGILNIVTKKPLFDKGGELSFRAGSYDFYKPAIDIYGPVNNSKVLAYRMNASFEKAGSFRDQVHSDRVYANPSLMIRAGKKTTILAEADYLSDERTLDYGTGAVDYSVANLPRSRFLGASWSYTNSLQKTATLTVSHLFNPNWKLNITSGYQGYHNELYGTTRPNASNLFIKPDGTWARGLQKAMTDEDYFITQADITGNFKTGNMHHVFLAGADADKYITNARAFEYKNPATGNSNIYDTINIFDPGRYNQRSDIPALNGTTRTHTPVKRIGLYVQDLLSFSKKFKLLTGIRYTNQKTQSAYTDSLQKNKRINLENTNDEAFSPRLGVVYQPLKTLSLFVSYASSFVVNSGLDVNNNPLKPSNIDQVEAGIKSELFNKNISANLTVYDIINNNFAQSVFPAPASTPSAKELAGTVTSKGVEIDLATKPIYGFQLLTGYSFNETKYTKSNTFIEGSSLRYNPQHTAHASLYYTFSNRTFLKGFNLGLMSYYIGERVAGRSTRIQVTNDTYKLMQLPDYFQFDASAGYRFEKISIRIKVTNLFNQLSYYVHDDNSVNPIAPTQFAATFSMKF